MIRLSALSLALVIGLVAGLFLAVQPFEQPALAVQPHEKLDDPVLEARARELSAIVRCLVCQNQSIDDSDAELAADLRVIVRERLVAGDSNDDVLDYLVDRYGDFVLLRPPFKPETYLLYFGPLIFLILALGAAVLYFRRRQTEVAALGTAGDTTGGEPGLSQDEKDRLERILKRDGDQE